MAIKEEIKDKLRKEKESFSQLRKGVKEDWEKAKPGVKKSLKKAVSMGNILNRRGNSFLSNLKGRTKTREKGTKSLISQLLPQQRQITKANFRRQPKQPRNPQLRNDGRANDFRNYQKYLQEVELQQRLQQERQLSPNTERILSEIRRVHNLSKTTDAAMQRRIRERRAISKATSLLDAPNIFRHSETNSIDPTREVEEFSILKAPNLFKHNPENNIMDTKGRPTVLQTTVNGWDNNIMHRRADSISLIDGSGENNLFSQENSRRNRLSFFH